MTSSWRGSGTLGSPSPCRRGRPLSSPTSACSALPTPSSSVGTSPARRCRRDPRLGVSRRRRRRGNARPVRLLQAGRSPPPGGAQAGWLAARGVLTGQAGGGCLAWPGPSVRQARSGVSAAIRCADSAPGCALRPRARGRPSSTAGTEGLDQVYPDTDPGVMQPLSSLVRVVFALLIPALLAGTQATSPALATPPGLSPILGRSREPAITRAPTLGRPREFVKTRTRITRPPILGPAAARALGVALTPRPQLVNPFAPPATTYGSGHRGIDLAPTGMSDQVSAVAAGVVTHVGRIAGRGPSASHIPATSRAPTSRSSRASEWARASPRGPGSVPSSPWAATVRQRRACIWVRCGEAVPINGSMSTHFCCSVMSRSCCSPRRAKCAHRQVGGELAPWPRTGTLAADRPAGGELAPWPRTGTLAADRLPGRRRCWRFRGSSARGIHLGHARSRPGEFACLLLGPHRGASRQSLDRHDRRRDAQGTRQARRSRRNDVPTAHRRN